MEPVEIRIVAGEATHEEYSQVYERFRGLLHGSFALIRMVVGPVVSGDYLGRCSLFELAREFPGRFLLRIPANDKTATGSCFSNAANLASFK